MDFDLEIISEEGERLDPLFDSIMNAMNSMKEATADKIYRKIQKDGATNYSKPQVDKALENALRYGIFEVRNNRYRVRDDVLDDEDTVYWKFGKKRDQTPFRIEENVDEKPKEQKLDPEKDNKRFKKPVNNECLHCGRTIRSESVETNAYEGNENKEVKSNEVKEKKKKRCKTVTGKGKQKRRKAKPRTNTRNEKSLKRKATTRGKVNNPEDGEKSTKRMKLSFVKGEKGFPNKLNKAQMEKDYYTHENLWSNIRKETVDPQDEGSDSSDAETDLLSPMEPTCSSFEPDRKANIDKTPRTAFSSDCIAADLNVFRQKVSSSSIKSLTRSEKSYASTISSNDQSQSRTDDYYNESPNNSGNVNDKLGNQYLSSSDTYRNQYKRGQTENKGSSDWLSGSDEQQGTIIQANNVLTIEPMDSLPFTEHASYIS